MAASPDFRPSPGPRAVALGVLRMAAAAGLLAAGTVAVLAASLWPRLPDRVGPVERLAQALARGLLAVAGVRRQSGGLAEIAGHRGFVFFNHASYLDPLVLAAAAPMRFLAAAGVRRLPLVGWIATALGTLYVHRGREASRVAARKLLAQAVRQSPVPVALAPEGRIGPGDVLLPFRHGAFEVAAETGAPVLMVALRFEPHAAVLWHDGEWLVRAFWRLCARTAPVAVEVVALPPARTVRPGCGPGEAGRAEALIRQELGLKSVPEPGYRETARVH